MALREHSILLVEGGESSRSVDLTTKRVIAGQRRPEPPGDTTGRKARSFLQLRCEQTGRKIQ